LLIALAPEDEQTVAIRVRVYPARDESYLMPHLRVLLLSETGEVLQEVESRSQDNAVQLNPFSGHPGERFSIQVVLNEASVVEEFII
jgi:hypothetical protein